MDTLYYSPGACSLIVHCLLEEMGSPFEARRVDLAAKEHHGEAYRRINPKGKVPALVTAEGTLTECMAIIEHICDRQGDAKLLPRPGTWQRAKTFEQMATLATEVHPLFNRFFHADDFSDDTAVQGDVKSHATARLVAYFRAEDEALDGRTYWSGDTLSAADFYFMVIARWGRWLEPSALRMKNIERFFRRMTERPAVARAMGREGIKAFG